MAPCPSAFEPRREALSAGVVLDFTPRNLDPRRLRLRELSDARAREQRRSFRLSMSVGGASLPVGSELSVSELLDRADAAMYEQKNARRAAGVSLVPPALGDRD
jgi:GGDEF domain-containing protein